MRRPLATLGGVGVLVLALHLTGAPALGGLAQPRTRSVTVHIRCAGGSATSRVNPDPVEMVQGEELAWVLTDSSDVEAFSIVPRDIPNGRAAQEWPFADGPGARRGERGTPARGRGMRANAAGRYRYDVTASCAGGDEVTIDPDIIIRAR